MLRRDATFDTPGRRLRTRWPACAAVALAIACPFGHAAVTQVVIDSSTAVDGAAVPYTTYKGRVFGELDPADPHNSIIQDISLSPRNAQGRVAYVATFQLTTPSAAADASGLLMYEVSNRGNNAIPAGPALVAGASYLQSGWQGDLLANCASSYPCTSLSGPYAGGRQVLQVPVATHPDGSAITGKVYGHIVNATGSTAQMVIYSAPVPYKPVSLTDPERSTLWSLASQSASGIDGRKSRLVLGRDWAWADCRTTPFPGTPDPTRVCLASGFDPNLLYEMVFESSNPLVLGVGYAATRDVISFFRHAAVDRSGNANPVAGRVSKVVSIGSSQSAAFIRGSIFYGFNEDESNRQVVDGAWAQIDGRMLYLNARFALPDVITNLYMMGDEAPVWWAPYPNRARGGPATGILSRCVATSTCPQIMETFGSLEMYAEKMSPDLVGMTAVEDIPLPANVHRYYSPATTHGGGPGGFDYSPVIVGGGNCMYPGNPNPSSDTYDALQDDFLDFIMNGTPMPASRYPKLRKGELVRPIAEELGFPRIPGYPYGGGRLWPVLKYDFGPHVDYANQTGIVTVQPPRILEILPSLVPRVDDDGNEQVGVPSVNLQAPLATYTGWNITSRGPYAGQQCSLAGSSYPFALTRAQRLAASDPRLSVEERYGTHAGFVCAVSAAAWKAVGQRFLRSSAAAALVEQASESNVLVDVTPTSSDVKIGNRVCARARETR